ncbi:MAG: hypothetical protein KFKLKKLM_00695 [Flavobacteriales bacterium]|nr:hypothetical protein [Flavobacteriales bacterium]
MGKGDIKSKKGKITNGSYGVKRKRKSTKAVVVKPKPKKEVVAKETKVEKAPVKKEAAKKTVAKASAKK